MESALIWAKVFAFISLDVSGLSKKGNEKVEATKARIGTRWVKRKWDLECLSQKMTFATTTTTPRSKIRKPEREPE